jgi:Spy/CpxP family protein refolding chaperone
MIKNVLAAALLLVLAVAAAQADPDFKGRWWHEPAVADQLQLTEPEIRLLDQAFETSRNRMIELKGQLEIEQGKLRALMERSKMNEAEVKEQHRRQEAARADLADARFEFLMEVRRIIGPERFAQVSEMRLKARKRQ